MKSKVLISALVLAILGLSVAVVDAQRPPANPQAPPELAGTAFTYQGQLKSNGALVNNTCDLQFSLWDDDDAGSVLATIIKNGVSVTNGLFTVQLNYGSTDINGLPLWNGEARWVSLAVRCPAGAGNFTSLTPRQALTPAPYALALPGLFTQQNTTSSNVIGGYYGNNVTPTGVGATIGGGGSSGATNQVTDNFGTIGGGTGNIVGDGNTLNITGTHATVGGGQGNTVRASHSTIGGGYGNTASVNGNMMTIGGGYSNTVNNFYATVGGGYTNAANSNSATVSGGYLNTSDGAFSTISGGYNNTASGLYATVPGGLYAVASHYGEMAYANGRFANSGDAQTSVYVLRNQTVDATQTELFLGPGSPYRITIASDRTLVFDILVVGRSLGGNSAGYDIRGVIERMGAATSFIGSPSVTTLGEDRLAWSVTVDDEDTNDALVILVTGENGFDIHWVATVRTVEVAH